MSADRFVRWLSWQPPSFSSAASRSMDSGTDALVGAAAADIGDRVINIGIGRFWLILEQHHDGHDHSTLAISALWDIVIDPRLAGRGGACRSGQVPRWS